MLKAEEVLLTPELALAWRSKNINNFRKISPNRVSMYASEIVSGNWKLNGEPIVFDNDGVLVNGQHRIEAVIKANTPIRVLVVTGVEKNDCIFDSGLIRSSIQIAKAQGVTLHNAKIAAVNYMLSEGKKLPHGKIETLEYYKQHCINFDFAFDFATRGGDKPKLKKAGCIAAIYCAIVLNALEYEDIVTFCKIVNSNIPQDGFCNEPAFALVNTINSRMGNGSDYIDWCFNVTWAALMRYKKQSKNTKKYKGDGDNHIKVIEKVKAIEKMMTKGEAV